MFDFHEAIKAMHQGKVVKYVGTVNGNVWTENGGAFCNAARRGFSIHKWFPG